MHKRKIILAGLLVASLVLAKQSLAQYDYSYDDPYGGLGGSSFGINYQSDSVWTRTNPTSNTIPGTGTTPTPTTGNTRSTGNTSGTTTGTTTTNANLPAGTKAVRLTEFGHIFYNPGSELLTNVTAEGADKTVYYNAIINGVNKGKFEIGKITGTGAYPQNGYIYTDKLDKAKTGATTTPSSPAITRKTAPDDSAFNESAVPADTTPVKVDAVTGKVFHTKSGAEIPDTQYDPVTHNIFSGPSSFGKMLTKNYGYVNWKNFIPAGGFPTTGCKNNPGQIVNSNPEDSDFKKVKIMDASGTLQYHPEKSGDTEGPVATNVKVNFPDKSFYVEVDGAKRMVGTFIYDDEKCYPQYGYIVPSYVAKYTAIPEVKEEPKKEELEKPQLEEKKTEEPKLEQSEKRKLLESAKTAPKKPKIFIDVAPDASYSASVSQALRFGWIPEAKKFRPNKRMTRCDFAKLALTAANVPLDDSYAGELKDVPADSEFAPYVNSAVRLGILPPRRKKTFACGKFVTRAEAEAALAVGTGRKSAEIAKDKGKEKLTRGEIIQMLVEALVR